MNYIFGPSKARKTGLKTYNSAVLFNDIYAPIFHNDKLVLVLLSSHECCVYDVLGVYFTSLSYFLIKDESLFF